MKNRYVHTVLALSIICTTVVGLFMYEPPIHRVFQQSEKNDEAFPYDHDEQIEHMREENEHGLDNSAKKQVNERTQLVESIAEIAEQVYVPPQDAYVDRIWQAIPGYNGRFVDEERTYELATIRGQLNEETLVVREIEPDIQLEDIQPRPIYRGNSQKPMVSFMVNVAWGSEHVLEMLDILHEHQVSLTFFVDGTWLKNNKEIAQKIMDHGHELGNHAYSHPDLQTKTEQEIRDEMVKTEQLLAEFGHQSTYFAPPSGAFDDRVVRIAHELGMFTVLWTLDTIDWREPSYQTIVQRIVPNLENGHLVLMHPTKPTVEALPYLLEGAAHKDLVVGPLSQVLDSSRYPPIFQADVN